MADTTEVFQKGIGILKIDSHAHARAFMRIDFLVIRQKKERIWNIQTRKLRNSLKKYWQD